MLAWMAARIERELRHAGAAHSMAVLGMLGALLCSAGGLFGHEGGCEYIAELVSNAWSAWIPHTSTTFYHLLYF